MQALAINRREAIKLAGTGVLTSAALAATGGLTGCNAQQWIQTALNDLPIVIQVVTSILSIVGTYSAKGVDPNLIAKVNAVGKDVNDGLTLAQTLVTEYQTAAASAKPGVLSRLDTALTVALQNTNQILGLIGGASIAPEVAAALGSAITAIVAIMSLIPAPPLPPTPTPQLNRRIAIKKAVAAGNGGEVLKEAFDIIVSKSFSSNQI